MSGSSRSLLARGSRAVFAAATFAVALAGCAVQADGTTTSGADAAPAVLVADTATREPVPAGVRLVASSDDAAKRKAAEAAKRKAAEAAKRKAAEKKKAEKQKEGGRHKDPGYRG